MQLIKYCIVVFGLFLATLAQAQIGFKLGVHTVNIDGAKDIVLRDDRSISYKDADLGFQGGLYGRIPIGSFFLEPRVMFHTSSVKYTINGENGSIVDNIVNETFTNLDIPLLIGKKILFLDIMAGVVAHVHLDAASDLINFSEYNEKFKNASYGWRLGAGGEIDRLSLSVEYEGNFSRFGNHITFGGRQFDFGDQTARIVFNLGYRIF